VALGLVNGQPVVVSGSWDCTVRLWDARSYSLLRIVLLRSKVICLAMGNDSAVAVGAEHGLMVFDFLSGVESKPSTNGRPTQDHHTIDQQRGEQGYGESALGYRGDNLNLIASPRPGTGL
jgi:WD40 repeat protein